MLNSKTEALGIIFPNSYDAMVPDLVSERLMASIPFASRYRMCDFILSSMVHSGIDNISIIVRKNYHSLLDHLGAGREWDLVRKNGGLNIVPPFAQKQVKVFEGRIEALESLRGYLLKQPQKYVIMTDANIAINFDFNELLDAHIKSGADVTMMYRKQEIPKAFIRQSRDRMDLYYALGMNGDRVSKIYINPTEEGEMNFSMNIYVVEREFLIHMIDDAYVHDVPQAGNSEGIYPSEQGPHGSVLCTRHERRPRQQDLHQPDRRGGDEFQHEYLCGRTRVFDPYDR